LCATSLAALGYPETVVDRLTREHRSWNMGRISGRDTKPEIVVRRVLHRLGYRFRLHSKNLPGRPDIVLPRWQTVIFVHGCFWHRHPGCRFAYSPKSRVEFWMKKFDENIARDHHSKSKLEEMGWRVEVIWECETAKLYELENRIRSAFALHRPEQVADR
jgi:DNA mismatch endonuclease (patch repair protein)